MERDFQIILPKQKRLKDEFEPLLQRAGFRFNKQMSRQAYGECADDMGQLPAFNASMRKPDDALRKLMTDKADMAVIGSDKFLEAQSKARLNGEGDQFKIDVVMDFNCAACSMYIAAAPEREINSTQDLNGLTIATSFPNSLKIWLQDNGVTDFTVVECDGDTEDEVRDGSADAIFEIVDSGRSLVENNLETKIFAYNINAVLVARSELQTSRQAEIGNLLQVRLRAASQNEDFQTTIPAAANAAPICA